MPVKRQQAGSSTNQKRTRFASPSPAAGSSTSAEPADGEQELLEEDLPEGSRKSRSREKRKLKDAEGYGSDSSNDDEGVVPSRRPGTKGEEEDDDVDMFAEDAAEKDQGKDGDNKGKGKDKEFLDLNEIEGQEFDRAKRGGTTDDSDSDDGGGEKTEAQIRRKNKETALGFEVTPFNMKTEMEEGRFTADGESFIANERDTGDKHDVWLADMDKEEIRKARKAHKERERVEREREEREAEDTGREEERLLGVAVGSMERGETVLEALQRLGKEVEEKRVREEGRKKTWVERQKERKAMKEEEQTGEAAKLSNPFTHFSDIVSALTAIGHLDVYSLSRESIQRMLPEPSMNGPTFNGNTVPAPTRPRVPTDDRQFQYRFSLNYVRNIPEAQRPVEREVFGPFSVMQLQAWKQTGFFGPLCENVELRVAQPAGESAASWSPWKDIIGS